MKKTLRTILAGAVTLLAVSCYDDSLLREELDDLGVRFEAIEEIINGDELLSRLTAAETAIEELTALKGQVTDIVGKLDAFDKEVDGKIADFEAAVAALVAADKDLSAELVEAVAKIAVTKVEDKDGNVVLTLADGSTVALSDGSDYKISDVKDNDDHVVVTIGEVSYNLPKYVVAASIELSRADFYVGYGLSKTVTVTGAEEFYVAAKPDGWKVTADGNTITVTAPSKAAAELGVIEAEGEIVIHADADKCTYASMNVRCGEAFSVEIQTATGDITFFNALSVEYPDYTGMGSPTYDFGDALVGILPLSDFEYFTSVDELISAAENWNISSGYYDNIKRNLDLSKPYEAGVYEEEEVTINIADLGASFWPQVEISDTVHYVVWAVPQTNKVLKDLYTFAYYKPIRVSLEEKSKSFNEIELSLTCSGASEYYVSMYPASMFEYQTFEDYMENGYGFGGPLKQFRSTGNGYNMGTPYTSGSQISLQELNYGALDPNSKYIVTVFPIQEGKDPETYTFAEDVEPYVFEFTTDALVAGGTPATVSLDEATTYTTLSVKVTPAEGTTAYYYFFEPGAADDYTDDELAAYVMSRCYWPLTEEEVVDESGVSAGASKEVVVVTVSDEGVYAIAREVYSTPPYPYDSNITATLTSLTLDTDTGEYTAVFAVSGADKFVAWNSYSANVGVFPGNVVKYGAEASYATYKWVDVVDGVATVVFKPNSTWYSYLVYSAYNVTDGAVSGLMEAVGISLSDSLTE